MESQPVSRPIDKRLFELPFELIILIFLYAGTTLDELAFEYFRKRATNPIVGYNSQFRLLCNNINDHGPPLALVNLLIHWWKIPRYRFDALILKSIRTDQVQCLRLLLKFWDLHVCCKTDTCQHLHPCYRFGKCNYLMGKTVNSVVIPHKCIRFLVDEYGYPIDIGYFWLKCGMSPNHFRFIQEMYVMYEVIGKKHLSILSEPDVFIFSRFCSWEIRRYTQNQNFTVLLKIPSFYRENTDQIYCTHVVNWLISIGINARDVSAM